MSVVLLCLIVSCKHEPQSLNPSMEEEQTMTKGLCWLRMDARFYLEDACGGAKEPPASFRITVRVVRP